jgi:CubicO group peptidase (beta-lactamase class C family)
MKHFFSILMSVSFLNTILFSTNLIADDPVIPELTQILEPYIVNQELPGIVAVAADGEKIRSIHCLGWADIETKKPMKPDTLFWIASHSKLITRSAVMLLVDEGKIDLNEPVTTYLPELNSLQVLKENTETRTVLEKPEHPITLRHLLSHTSGMGWIPELQRPHKFKIDCVSLQQAVMLTAMTPLEAEPGIKYIYSNQGINIAAAIVERLSKMPFEEFLQTRFFEPLGMVDTTFLPNKEQLSRLAKIYRKDKNGELVESKLGQLNYPLDAPTRHPEAAGGLFSTALDCIRFQQMYANRGVWKGKRILSESAIEDMHWNQKAEAVLEPAKLKKIEFGLNASGSDAQVDPQKQQAIIYFVQSDGLPKNQEAKTAFINAAWKILQNNP